MPDSRRLRIFALVSLLICLGTVTMVSGVGAQRGEQTALAKNADHCSVIEGNSYNETVACQVWDHRPLDFSEPRQIEIYRKSERLMTIELGDPIQEWHFWDKGRRISVAYGVRGEASRYALYDLSTGKQVDAVSAGSVLPQWAKSQSQLQDESVPGGAIYKQERTLWVAKVLRELDGVKVGMHRKELFVLLTIEGGMSTRTERTYVSVECPYIKMDLKFTPVGLGRPTERERRGCSGGCFQALSTMGRGGLI